MSSRIAKRFAELKAASRGGLGIFIAAGDPDYQTSLEILNGLPQAGADFIELGLPFSDPMADGPSIQASSLRALKAGASAQRTLEMAKAFRHNDNGTPLIIMGYYNPIYVYGAEAFARDASEAGVDGLIIVDLPPEEAGELLPSLRKAGLSLIYLVAPTTDDQRLPKVLANASGFIYYVAVAGVTGTKPADALQISQAVLRLRRYTDLPVAVGFGVRTPKQAAAAAMAADAAVVGSAVADKIAENLDAEGGPGPGLVKAALDLVYELSKGVRGARAKTPKENA